MGGGKKHNLSGMIIDLIIIAIIIIVWFIFIRQFWCNVFIVCTCIIISLLNYIQHSAELQKNKRRATSRSLDSRPQGRRKGVKWPGIEVTSRHTHEYRRQDFRACAFRINIDLAMNFL